MGGQAWRTSALQTNVAWPLREGQGSDSQPWGSGSHLGQLLFCSETQFPHLENGEPPTFQDVKYSAYNESSINGSSYHFYISLSFLLLLDTIINHSDNLEPKSQHLKMLFTYNFSLISFSIQKVQAFSVMHIHYENSRHLEVLNPTIYSLEHNFSDISL